MMTRVHLARAWPATVTLFAPFWRKVIWQVVDDVKPSLPYYLCLNCFLQCHYMIPARFV